MILGIIRSRTLTLFHRLEILKPRRLVAALFVLSVEARMKTRMVRLLATLPALALVLILTSGCGGEAGVVKKVTVTGTVTYDGQPVDGVIMFTLGEANLKGGSNTTGFVKSGKFSVAGVTPGKNTVTVAASEGSSGAAGAAAGNPMQSRGQMPDMRDPKKAQAEREKKKSSDQIPSDA